MADKLTLMECPVCRHIPEQWTNHVTCSNIYCCLRGPDNDPDGALWNALPRKKPVGECGTIKSGPHFETASGVVR